MAKKPETKSSTGGFFVFMGAITIAWCGCCGLLMNPDRDRIRSEQAAVEPAPPPAPSPAPLTPADHLDNAIAALDLAEKLVAESSWTAADAALDDAERFLIWAQGHEGVAAADERVAKVRKTLAPKLAEQECADGKQARELYTELFETTYLRRGQDVEAGVRGKCGEELRIKYVFCGRPFVFNLAETGEPQAVGFKKVRCDTGFGEYTTADF